MELKVGAEFQSVIICSNGVELKLIGKIEFLDFEGQRAEVQYRYPSGNLGGLAWTHFSKIDDVVIEDWRGKKAVDYGESVTYVSSLAGDEDESVTHENHCQVCGKGCSKRAKTCSPKCRKALSRLAAA